jgi:3-oxoadipate enol-lactonase
MKAWWDVPYLDLDDGPVEHEPSVDGAHEEPGFRLYYETHGPAPGSPGAGTAVLLAHGAGGNSLSWWQQIPALSDRYPVITFDHRHFGRSRDIEDGPGRIAFGSDVRRLLDHLGVDRVHFVGHSMGGRTAFGLVSRAPDRLVSLVYSGTNGGCVDDRYRAQRQQLEEDGTLSGTLLQRALAEGFRAESPEMHFLYGRIRSWNPRRGADFLAPTGRMVNRHGTTADRLRELGVPILWVVGEHDRVVPPQLIRISHDLTPGSRFHLVEGAGHSAYFERPDDWNGAVRSFLDEVEARSGARTAEGARG